MTIQQLSAQTVKVQISQDELHQMLGADAPQQDSGRFLSMIAVMLTQAELVSRIPFSAHPVTAEMLKGPEGGLTVYFSLTPQKQHAGKKTASFAALFPDEQAAAKCCKRLMSEQSVIIQSSCHLLDHAWILSVKAVRTGASCLRHILLEYGQPFRMSRMNRARLSEYGTPVCINQAVQQLAERADSAAQQRDSL